MVGLADIPCFGIVVQKVSEYTVEAAIHGLRYLLCSGTLVNQLNSDIEKVSIQEGKVSRKIDAALTDGKTIEKDVLDWQKELETKKTLADELSQHRTTCTCFNVLLPDPVSRFRVGRKASHLSTNIAALNDSGEKHVTAEEVGYLPPFDNVPTSTTKYRIFPSREYAYKKLWEALVDQNGDPILAIYGMPGVGKTWMMEQASVDARQKNIFDKVVRVNVSENFSVITLQDKLATSLGCHLESKDDAQRSAFQLKNSLTNENKKILVILDDVWDIIPLTEVGIPFGDGSFKGCKILLTSRKIDVCVRNDCKDPIKVETLTESEAWEMFQSAVGSTNIEDLNDTSLANKVCKKCANLPLVIQAVGSALKHATNNMWRDALLRLENDKFEEIEGIDAQAHAGIKLSVDNLNLEARKCLFLCSSFGEDEDIDIQMLVNLATGCQLLADEINVHAKIDILKSSSLLLVDEFNETVKLHDIIRAVARSVAATYTNSAFFPVKCSSWSPDTITPSPRLLQLDMEEEDNVRLADDGSVLADVHTLWLQGNGYGHWTQLSSGFFERFTNLKFLVIQRMSLLHPDQMPKLRTIILLNCNVSENFISSISGNLEILCTWKCALPHTLKLPELKGLRKLELVDNYRLSIVEDGVISGLSRLEELKIVGEFRIGSDGGGRSIFSELSQLSRFKNLMIDLDNDSESYPDEEIVNKLVKFSIHVGLLYWHTGPRNLLKNSIKLSMIDIEKGWMGLVERAEIVELDNVKGLGNGFSREAFANLNELEIKSCEELKQVVRWEGRNQQLLASSTINLTICEISYCSQLKYLFPASVAKCLQKMQKLRVYDCKGIEQIIRVEEDKSDQGEIIICFPKLRKLHLMDLPNLTNFSTHEVKLPCMENMTIKRVHRGFSMEEMTLGLGGSNSTQGIELGRDNLNFPPKLNILRLDVGKQNELPTQWLLELQNIKKLNLRGCRWTAGNLVFNSAATFGRLKELIIENSGARSLFTYSSLTFLQQLENIRVLQSPLLEEIGWGDEPYSGSNAIISLPRLRSLFLSGLPKLKRCGIFACNMPALESLRVWGCELSTLLTSSAFTSLQQLKELEVGDCPLLESIVEDEMHDQTPNKTISLLFLNWVELKNLPKLKNPVIFACNMPALKYVSVSNCGISTLFTSSASTSLQKLKDLEVGECRFLESIVEDEIHDQTPNKSISLLCLENLNLHSLPSLQSFGGSSNHALNMPALYRVTLYACPRTDVPTFLKGIAPEVLINTTRKYMVDLPASYEAFVKLSTLLIH